MKKSSLFELLCTVVLCMYCSAVAQAGQVITAEERSWASEAVAQEAHLGTIQSSKSIAVLNFHNKTGQAKLNALQKGMALMLITDLSKVEDIYVLERIRMQALVDEMDLGEAGLVDPETAPQVGKYLKAYYVVNGDISEGSIEPLQVDPSLLDVPFESLTDLPPAAGSLEEIYRVEKDVLFTIIEELNIYLSPEKKRELQEPLSVSAAALLALFLGIDHSDKGNYTEAAEMFERAAAEDPNLQLAKDSLQELKDMGLSSSEDVSRIEPEPETVAAESGSGGGTLIAVGIGVAALAGGAALFAASSSSDDDGGGQPSPQPEPTPQPGPAPPDATIPTASANKSAVTCYGDSVLFSFSEPMNTAAGSISTSPPEFAASGDWSGSQSYIVSWSGLSSFCNSSPPSTVAIQLNGFQSAADPPAPLGGTNPFSFELFNPVIVDPSGIIFTPIVPTLPPPQPSIEQQNP